jgi:uncharacterized membrane protein YdjX (TVP38/TMEM64 family)
VLELTSGFIFGFWMGWAVNATGKTSGGLVTFFISRCVAKVVPAAARSHVHVFPLTAVSRGQDYVTREITEGQVVLRVLAKMMTERQWYSVGLVMFAFLNLSVKTYGLGTMPCEAHVYTANLLLTNILYGAMSAHLGSSMKAIKEVMEGGGMSPVQVVSLTVGLLALVTVFIVVGVFVKAELDLAVAQDHQAEAEDGADPGVEELEVLGDARIG